MCRWGRSGGRGAAEGRQSAEGRQMRREVISVLWMVDRPKAVDATSDYGGHSTLLYAWYIARVQYWEQSGVENLVKKACYGLENFTSQQF